MVNISGLSRATVLAALYNHSKPLGMGYLKFQAGDMDKATAESLLEQTDYFDYLRGRVMKVHLPAGATAFDEALYDRDNGGGAAQRAVDSTR